jgi:oxygenase/bifunctional oxygenase/reductase
MDAQIVIAGAGPVGLMLAAELRLGGAQVLVLERLAAPTTQSRASTLHARTMELFEQRGLLSALGGPPRELTGHYGGVALDHSGQRTAFPGLWKVPQAQVEVLLGAWARRLGAEVRRGHEVRGVAAVEDRGADAGVRIEVATPVGATALTAQYLVGCDGEDSAVRRLAGFGFSGAAASRRLLRADVAGITVRDRRFERLPNGLAIAATRSGVTRVMVHAAGLPDPPTAAQPGFDDVVRAWKHVTGEDISAGTPIWVNGFDDANLQADRYRIGRVLLAGDAAHRQLPVGGQALNLGLQDAANLGWKLAAEVVGCAPAGLLDTYHEERHAAGRAVLGNIAAQTLLLLGGAEVEPLRDLLRELLALPEVRDRLAGAVSGLDLRYGADGDPLVGARLPLAELDPAAGAAQVRGPLRRGRGVLADLSGDPARGRRLVALAARWGARVEAASAGARPGSPLAAADTLLVRPDGYLAWAGDARSDPRPALEHWFGPPSAVRAAPGHPAGRRSGHRISRLN